MKPKDFYFLLFILSTLLESHNIKLRNLDKERIKWTKCKWINRLPISARRQVK